MYRIIRTVTVLVFIAGVLVAFGYQRNLRSTILPERDAPMPSKYITISKPRITIYHNVLRTGGHVTATVLTNTETGEDYHFVVPKNGKSFSIRTGKYKHTAEISARNDKNWQVRSIVRYD